MAVTATSKVPTFRVRIAPTPYYQPIQPAGILRVDAIARGLMKPAPEEPIAGGLILNAIDVSNDSNLAFRLVPDLLNVGPGGTASYQAPALGAATLNLMYGSIGMVNAHHRAKESDRIGDKTGSLEGRAAMGKCGVLLTASTGYVFTRILKMVSAVVGVEVGAGSASLLGRVAYGFGVASTVLITVYCVAIAALAGWRINQRNTFLTKLDGDVIGGVYYERTTDQKIDYLRGRVLVFSEPGLPIANALNNHMALSANGGAYNLPMCEARSIAINTAMRSVAKYNALCFSSPEQLITMGKEWARDNLKLAIESFPEEFAEIKHASDQELDELLDAFFALKETREGRAFGEREKGIHYAELGKIAFFTHLEEKKDAKMSRILGMNQRELQELKIALVNPHLSAGQKRDIIDRIHDNVKKNNRFDYLLIGIMVIGVLGLIASIIFTGGIALIVGTSLSLAFAIAVLMIDGYSFYQAYKAGDIGKHDELIAKISIVIALVTCAIAVALLTTVSFGIVPLIMIVFLTTAWVGFKGTTWYLARKIRLEKVAAGPVRPPLGDRGIAPMAGEAQREIYNIFMRRRLGLAA